MKKICCLCKIEIKKKDTYFKIDLVSNGKKLGTDYCHKKCKDERESMQNKLNSLVDGVSNFATKRGIIPEKEIVIQ